MKNEVQLPANEIDVLWGIVKRYKLLVIFIILTSFIISVLYAFLVHVPEYRAVAKMQIGKRGDVLVEPLNAIKTKVTQSYRNSTDNNEIKSFNVSIEDEKEGTLRLTAIGENKNLLHDYLEETLSRIPKEHNLTQTYEEYIASFQSRLDLALKNKVNAQRIILTLRRNTLANTDEIMKDLNKGSKLDSNDTSAINKELISTLKVAKNYYLLEQLKTHQTRHDEIIKWARKKISPKYTYETQRIGNIYIKRITASKSIMVTTSVVSGVLLSLLLVLFLSFLAERKEGN